MADSTNSGFGSPSRPYGASRLGFPRPRLLRLSVTDRCNLRCLYCMPAQGIVKAAHGELLSLEELGAIAIHLSRHFGIERIKLTGGEPLVRKGIEHLIAQLQQCEGVREVSMTSNGSLLAAKAQALKDAGLARVNISLDSLHPERFSHLTRGGVLSDTLRGIDQALAAGLTPLKINTVLQRSSWREELPALLDFAAAHQLEIRFMELMRTGTERSWCESEFVSIDTVRGWLAKQGHIFEFAASGAEPAQRTLVSWRGQMVEVGWIAPRSHPFCSYCERLRLDAKGLLRRCLMDSATLSLRPLAEAGFTSEMRAQMRDYLEQKTAPRLMDNAASMSLIGG